MKPRHIFVSMLLMILPVLLNAGYLHNHLVETLKGKKSTDLVRVVVHLKGYPDLSGFAEKDYAGKREYMKEFAKISQQPVIDYLKTKAPLSDLRQYWIFNGFAVTLPKSVILDLVNRDDVDYIVDDYKIQMIHPQDYTKTAYPSGSEEVPWDRKLMKADKAWQMGYTGKGVVLGLMDTGSDVTHPALRDKWRGISAWDDEAYGMSTPEDHQGHGTGCSGIMVGAYNLGIAPQAKYVVVAILDSSGSGTTTGIHNGFSWIANLPDSLKPEIVSNSWGMDDWSSTEFWSDCLTWRNLGILPVFAEGNNSAAPDSQDTPGTYPTVIAVGASDKYDDIMYYSGRGGAPNQSPWDSTGAWYVSDWDFLKPDICAPADPVLTASPGGDYINDFNGTSSATPHVAGLAALIWQKNPDLTLSQVYDIIRKSAYRTLATDHDYPNDTFGWGRVDAYRALIETPEPTTPNIVIDTFLVNDRNFDNDGFLDPGETNVPIPVTLRNLGANADDVNAIISYTSNSYLTVPTDSIDFGAMSKGAAVTKSFYMSLDASAPESTYIYLTMKITDGVHTSYRFFNIFVPMQDQPAKTDTLVNDDGNEAYDASNDGEYANYNYFAERYEIAAAGTLKAIQVYWSGTATAETLFVWKHNSQNNAPDSTIWGYDLIDVNTANAWTTVTLTNPIYISEPGYFWVGVCKGSNNNAVPAQDDGKGVRDISLSTNDRTDPASWDLRSYWYTFMMRPIVNTEPVTNPLMTEVSSYRVDDNAYGNDDGYIDPGERVNLYLGIKNMGIAAYNVTGLLEPANSATASRIYILDSTADFGIIRHGDDGGTNNNSPFAIEMRDSVVENMDGTDPAFRLILSYNYKNGQSKTDTVNFTIYGPWTPAAYTEYFYPWGTGGLWLLQDDNWSYYLATFAQFGLDTLDSVYIDTVYIYGYNDGHNSKTLDFYIWDTDPDNFTPRNVLYQGSVSVAAGASGWQTFGVGQWVPGYFWYGQNCDVGATGTGLHAIWWGGALIGNDYTLANSSSATDWSSANIAGYIGLPISGYAEITHHHPQISYYRPQGWTSPVTVGNATGDTVVPDEVLGDTAVYVSGFVALERTDSTALIKANDTMENVFFVDNYGRSATILPGPDSLPGWSYTYYEDMYDSLPAGRHTFYMGLDWNHAIPSNIFNDYLRYWGQQYTLTPPHRLYINTRKFVNSTAPDIFGVSGGYNYQADVFRMLVTAPQWYVVALSNYSRGSSSDSIDLDMRLFTDSTEDALTGFTNSIEASTLGPDSIDFIAVNGRDFYGTLWPGVYSFGTTSDSFFVEEGAPSYLMQYPGSRTFTITIDNTDLAHVEDLEVPESTSISISVDNKSATQNITVYVFGNNDDQPSATSDPYKNPYQALASVDVNAGATANLTWTSGNADTCAFVIINKNATLTKSKATSDVTVGNLAGATKINDNNRPLKPSIMFANPMRSGNRLVYVVSRTGRVRVSVYDIAGREVLRPVDDIKERGVHTISPLRLASGIYFISYNAPGYRTIKKMVFVK